MNDSGNGYGLGLGLLLLLGIGMIGVVGIAIAVGKRSATTGLLPEATIYGKPIYNQPTPFQGAAIQPERAGVGRPMFENRQELQLIRGPDRLIEKIIIDRKVVQYEW